MHDPRPSYVAMSDGPFLATPQVPHVLPKVIDGYDPLKTTLSRYYGTGVKSTWDTNVELCQHALFCFGDMNQWINYHLNQVNLSDWCFTILEDTIRFICTGKRFFPLASLESFIRAAEDVQMTNELRKTRLEKISNLWHIDKKPLPSNYIGMWCSHEGGLRDLVGVLDVLFSGRRTR